MLEASKKKVHNFEVGDCVLLPVPKVDRGPADPPNLICVVTDKKNGVYQVGSVAGIVKQWFAAETFLTTRTPLLTNQDVDSDTFVSLREAVAKTSGGQGFSKCNCKPSTTQCQTRRCACFRKGAQCNSRCHNSLPCRNKWGWKRNYFIIFYDFNIFEFLIFNFPLIFCTGFPHIVILLINIKNFTKRPQLTQSFDVMHPLRYLPTYTFLFHEVTGKSVI